VLSAPASEHVIFWQLVTHNDGTAYSLTIPQGDTVLWIATDVTHRVTSMFSENELNSAEMVPNTTSSTYFHTFWVPGVYHYNDGSYPGMYGVITVTELGKALSTSLRTSTLSLLQTSMTSAQCSSPSSNTASVFSG